MDKNPDIERYEAAAHAMQTGVAMEMHSDPTPTCPKHLRVGVNAAMSDMGGLVQLLVAKGVITEAEYFKAIADAMEREAKSYEQRLSDMAGAEIKLR